MHKIDFGLAGQADRNLSPFRYFNDYGHVMPVSMVLFSLFTRWFV